MAALRTALWNYDRTLPLMEGAVKVEGHTLAIEVDRPRRYSPKLSRMPSTTLAALIVACSGSNILAQETKVSKEREAAMAKCTAWAQKKFIGEQHVQRATAYKACMKKFGQRP